MDLPQGAGLGMKPRLAIVVPCYNEQEVLPEAVGRMDKLLQRLVSEGLVATDSLICLVDDGSRDQTWPMIKQYAGDNSRVAGVKLSRNRGHQNALLCGLLTAPGDVLISIDADLQDDIEAIPHMLRRYLEGCDVVYGVRSRRDADSVFKRVTAEAYYRLIAAMGVQVVFNHADFRLMSRRAIEALREYPETHLFLRGLVPLLGFRSSEVYFERAERFAGESKYPLSKMLSLAWQGITSFTAYPLRLITGLGAAVSLVSLGMAAWAFAVRLFTNEALPGWASTVIPLYFLGGVQLLGLGVIGEYLAKIYEAGKVRPRFHVESLSGSAFAEAERSAAQVKRGAMS